ncbi:HPF/RaiA family ribosome-associated protein [Vibrio comitans]|uniref:HPF/RaiA family ribosome-associated protein n=1 Tax=Vibrio comitans TaxID=413401 RepID=UPI001142138F
MQITSHNVDISSQVRALIEEGYMSIHQFNLYILLLKCDVKWHESLGKYQVALKIYLQDQTLYVMHSNSSLESALDSAFCSLQMKLAKHEDMLGIKRLLRSKLEQMMCWLNLSRRKKVSL